MESAGVTFEEMYGRSETEGKVVEQGMLRERGPDQGVSNRTPQAEGSSCFIAVASSDCTTGMISRYLQKFSEMYTTWYNLTANANRA